MPTPFTRLGFQIPNFTFPDLPNTALFERVAAMAGKAEAQRNALLARRGLDWSTLPGAMKESISKMLVLGDADTVGEFVQRKVREPGLDGLVVNLPANGHEMEAIEFAGSVLGKALS